MDSTPCGHCARPVTVGNLWRLAGLPGRYCSYICVMYAQDAWARGGFICR